MSPLHTAGTEIQNASLPQLVVQSAGEAAPFLDGWLDQQTPPDMRDFLRLAAAGRDTYWILE